MPSIRSVKNLLQYRFKSRMCAKNLAEQIFYRTFAVRKEKTMHIIESHLQRIYELCRQYRVSRLFVFGSVLTPRFNKDSDVDFLVDFNEMPREEYVDNYLSLKDALMSLFGRKVDLLEDKGVRNNVLRTNIDRTKQLVYG